MSPEDKVTFPLKYLALYCLKSKKKKKNTYWIAVVKRFTVFLQSVEKLDIVFCLIGKVSDGHILLLPRLKERKKKKI